MNFFKRIKEQFNLFLYDTRSIVLRVLRLLNILVSITAISTILYYYGYPQTPESKEFLLNIIKGSFAFYVFNFFLRIIYDIEPRKFIRQNWFEAIMMVVLVAEGVSYNLFDTLLLESLFNRLGLESFIDFSTLFIQFYFFVVVILELSRNSYVLPNVKLHPATIFVASFLIIIAAGTGLLVMPEMTADGLGMPFVDALFTSTSAACVTGLSVVDVGSYFTYKGQVVLMLLFKVGGLNIISFGSFLLLFNKMGFGVKHDNSIETFVNKDSPLNTKTILGKIFFWSITIELIGAFLIFLFWLPDVPEIQDMGQRVFYSIFHSTSAFNNAGFSLFQDGLYNIHIRENYFVQIIIILLIFFGSLGFIAIFDLFEPKNLRERLKKPWKQISFATKIDLYFCLGILIVGAALFYLFEHNNTLEGKNFFEASIASLFQSISRTSGFNTVDIGSVGMPAIMVLMMIMFIGSSSSSTGGGIKTSTFAIIWAANLSSIKGSKHTELFKRTISHELVLKAMVISTFFVIGIAAGCAFLAYTEADLLLSGKFEMVDLIFEQVSAFATVGISRGLTGDLSENGRIVIINSMFIGRVGTLTLIYLFGVNTKSKNYKYPKAHTMVG
ncbi:MAG: TrkH family potassium uptake protein [Flavobacteriales bacterium]